jgi:hypothetical protein
MRLGRILHVSIIALVYGALVAASRANASIVISGESEQNNFPGTAGLAFFQFTFTATNPDQVTENTQLAFDLEGYTAPIGSHLLMTTVLTGLVQVGLGGDSSPNLLSFNGLVCPSPCLPSVVNSLTQNPDISGQDFAPFGGTADLMIASLSSPFELGESVDITLGANTSVTNVTALVELTPAPTPLPAALPLFATGIGAMGLIGWRRKRKAQEGA